MKKEYERGQRDRRREKSEEQKECMKKRGQRQKEID
jgi:hypothetical protein